MVDHHQTGPTRPYGGQDQLDHFVVSRAEGRSTSRMTAPVRAARRCAANRVVP